MVWTVKKYSHLLQDLPFTLRTDNAGLAWIRSFKDNQDKLKRWSLLRQFNFKVGHCPGKEKELAVFFSRNPVEDISKDLDDQERLLPPRRKR